MARYSAVIRPAGADGPFWVHSENPDGNPKTINVTTGLNTIAQAFAQVTADIAPFLTATGIVFDAATVLVDAHASA
jgi:hypothetical protein